MVNRFSLAVLGIALMTSTVTYTAFAMTQQTPAKQQSNTADTAAEKPKFLDRLFYDETKHSSNALNEVIGSRKNLRFFSIALKKTGLDARLAKEELTVFAPSDDAFAKLPPGKLNRMLMPEHRDELSALVLAHVLPGKIRAQSIRKIRRTPTLAGNTLNATTYEQLYYVNGVPVSRLNTPAQNGYLNVVETVLDTEPAAPKANQ